MPFDIINSGKQILDRAINSQYGSRVASAATNRVLEASHKVEARKEPQHAYRWEFLMSGIFGIKEEIQFYAQRTAIPAVTHETIIRYYAGNKYHYSGRENSTKILNVTFYDNQDLQIYRFFSKWMSQMNNYHLNKKVNPINYQKSVILRLKDTTDGIIDEEFTFEHCFPQEIGEVTLDYGSSEVMTFDVQFIFENVQIGYGVVDFAGDASEIYHGVSGILSSQPAQNLISQASSAVRSFI